MLFDALRLAIAAHFEPPGRGIDVTRFSNHRPAHRERTEGGFDVHCEQGPARGTSGPARLAKDRPGTAAGRGASLKPGWFWVRDGLVQRRADGCPVAQGQAASGGQRGQVAVHQNPATTVLFCHSGT